MRYHLIPACARKICLAGLVPRSRSKALLHRGPLRSLEHRYRAYRLCMDGKGTAC